jgi:integrase
MLLDNLDPVEEKRKLRATAALNAARAMSVEQAAREYFSSHSHKWRSAKTAQAFCYNMTTYINPVIGALSIAEIDTGLVLRVLEPYWHQRTVTMSRVRGQLQAIIDWAKARNLRSGDNPAAWRGHLDKLLTRKTAPTHLAALPYADIGQFVAELRKCEGIPARALEFLVLTAARSGEVIGATWDEINFDAKTWTVPKHRMKGAREHRVPLSSAAITLLRALPREGQYVFIGARAGRPISPMAMMMVLKRVGCTATVHGFRSTFRDWAAETTAYPNFVVEMALAHKIPSAVEASYRRGDLFEKRARLMMDWAIYCDRASTAVGEVVALRAAVS